MSGPPAFAPDVDLWIGRNETPLGLSEEIRVVAPVAFSFDGIIDEVRIYDRALARRRGRRRLTRLAPSGPPPLRPPVLPAGPKGPGRFGAYYTRLRYAEEWENPWRVGDAADVVVRFDETAEPAGLLARHKLHPGLDHGERDLVHQRILRDPGPGPCRRAPSPWPTSRPGSRMPGSWKATTPGSSSSGATPRSPSNYDLVSRRPADGLGRLGRGDLYRLPGRDRASARSGSGRPNRTVDPGRGQGPGELPPVP